VSWFRGRQQPRPVFPRREIHHPDPRTETKLQQIYSLRAAIFRQEQVIGEFVRQMAAARAQQDKASATLRGYRSSHANEEFVVNMKAQADRISEAQAGLEKAEAFIAACSATIAELAAGITDEDLSYLGSGTGGGNS
jgi:hypothetical protein